MELIIDDRNSESLETSLSVYLKLRYILWTKIALATALAHQSLLYSRR